MGGHTEPQFVHVNGDVDATDSTKKLKSKKLKLGKKDKDRKSDKKAAVKEEPVLIGNDDMGNGFKVKKDKSLKKSKRAAANGDDASLEDSAKRTKKKRSLEKTDESETDPNSSKRARFGSQQNESTVVEPAGDDDAEDTNIGLGEVVTEKVATNDVDSFGMSATTVSTLKAKGFKSLFDIQAQTFRLLRHENKDVIGRARTGSGKTLAFVLPIVESLVAEALPRKVRDTEKPLVLCLAPTRELAQQVYGDFEWIATPHKITTACFTGGTMKGPQKGALRRGLDVLVGTPGRVIDLMDEQYLSLAGVQYIVLDEADEMLSMGFQEAVEKILGACTTQFQKQTLLFSATIPRWVKDLAKKYMRVSETVTVDTVSDSKNRTNTDITHLAIACPPSERGETIADVIKVHTGALGKSIIFTDTKAEANDVANMDKVVSALGGAGVLHGDIPQGQRESTLAAYRDGKIRVLVATDVAARGLDIKDVDLILQTHPPSSYETYIHRSGRTGRAGKHGTCVTFYSSREKYMIGLIEHKAGIKMHRANPPQAADIVKASVADTVKKIAAVHPENLELFGEVANKVIQSYDSDGGAKKALAAALACMAGYTEERFKSRSLLSCFQGYVAAVVTAQQEMDSQRHAWNLVKQTVGYEVAGELRGMQVCKDRHLAVFDLPDKYVHLVKANGTNNHLGVSIDIARDKLPDLGDDDFDMQAATAAANERRFAWRDKRGSGGGRGGGRGGGQGGFRGSFGGGQRGRSSWGGNGGGGGRSSFGARQRSWGSR